MIPSDAVPQTRTTIAVIAGDGIGPEVMREGVRLLEWYRDHRGLPIDLVPLDLGADRYLRDGVTIPPEVLAHIEREGACVLLGALGDPRVPEMAHAREILLGTRMRFDLYANIRPVRALADRLVPLVGRSAADVDLVIVRENTEGAYVGMGGIFKRDTPDEIAIAEEVHTRKGVERIIRAAFAIARSPARTKRRVCMVDKANAMGHAHSLWTRVFGEVSVEFPDVMAEHEYIDAACLHLVQDPRRFDVIVTNNLFGDILSDLAAALAGGLGMAPSANVHFGVPSHPSLFEPVHGSAPQLAGRSIANPFATLLTVGMLLAHIGHPDEALRIERGVRACLMAGIGTPDIGGTATTDQAGGWILDWLTRTAFSDQP